MIREYAPIGLIPAAWAMTFAKMIYPRIDTYWIQHMHYFMILFLAGFTVLSWKEMESNPVLDIWRKVIAAGVLFTGLGALSFKLSSYSLILGLSSLAYWFLAPGIALYHSANYMDDYSETYERLGNESVIAFLIFSSGIYFDIVWLQMLGLVVITATETLSIIIASKMDN